jgi:murein DD-endopeptidase MepM/ murein hydrolase activator NlpD
VILLAGVLLFWLGVRADCSTSSAAEPPPSQTLTPLLLSVPTPPVPFTGSDGRTHLDYELWLKNFSSAGATIEQVRISGDGTRLATLNAAAVARQLQPAGTRKPSGSMPASTQSLLFIDLIIPPGLKTPRDLSNQVTAKFTIDSTRREFTATLNNTPVNNEAVVEIGPPLRGSSYISADSCCTSSRHRRAALAVDGKVWISQRFAVDWEQLNAQGRIYSGPKTAVTSYTIYGKPVLAVANGTVVTAINDQPNQLPGQFPKGLTPDQADGNAVILDLGRGICAMYAHMRPGSVRVHVGDKVTRGEIIGLVGNSGNTIAPHLHFQVMDGLLSLASNGLPYEIDSFRITGISPSTEAFDYAEANGTPLDIMPVLPPRQVHKSLPLDQLIISFGS